MRPHRKYPTTLQKPPHQLLIYGCHPLNNSLPPGQCLPIGKQVTIFCHPAGKLDVEKQEGRNPPCRRGGWGGGKGRSHPCHHHTLHRGFKGVEGSVVESQGPQPRRLGWASGVSAAPLVSTFPLPHGWWEGWVLYPPAPARPAVVGWGGVSLVSPWLLQHPPSLYIPPPQWSWGGGASTLV